MITHAKQGKEGIQIFCEWFKQKMICTSKILTVVNAVFSKLDVQIISEIVY